MLLSLLKTSEGTAFTHPNQFQDRYQGGHLVQLHHGRGQELSRGWSPSTIVLAVGAPIQLRRGGVCADLPADSAMVLEEGAQYSLGCPSPAQCFSLMLARPAATASQAWLGRRLLPEWIPADDPSLAPLLLLNRRCRSTPAGRLDDQGLVSHFLHGLRQRQLQIETRLQRCPGRTLAHKRDVLGRLARVAALLDAPGGNPADLCTMAELANYSPTHFLRLFAGVYGASPHDYQVQVRLQKAHRLLLDTQLAVRDIAETVGFDSRSTFNRLFRRAYGRSAAELRDRQQGQTASPQPRPAESMAGWGMLA